MPSNNTSQQAQQSSFQRVMSDIADLCELQMQLLSLDSQLAKRRAIKAVVFLLVAGIVAFCAFVVAAVAVGYLIHEQLQWPLSASMATAGLIFLVLAGLSGWLGSRQIGKANAALSETKRELSENVRWIKSVMLAPKTSPRNQLRREDFPPEFVERTYAHAGGDSDPSHSRF